MCIRDRMNTSPKASLKSHSLFASRFTLNCATTLVSFVGLLDPLRGVTQIVSADINWQGLYWEPYIFVAVIFFLICFGMSRYSMYLERKLKTDHR